MKEIDRSIKEVLFQIDAMEANVRKNGDLPGLEKAKEIRAAFTERGELADSINRDEYAILRKNAIADLTAKKNVLIVRLLEIKQDTNAQKLDSEFTDLVDPLQADLLARWTVAVQSYRSDFDVAKALILSQLKRKEELARENANPSAVEEAINSIALFKEHGIVPIGVSTATYEARLKTARDKLEQVNKSLVRSLLLARKDEKARDMLARFSTTVIRDSKTNSKGSATPRR